MINPALTLIETGPNRHPFRLFFGAFDTDGSRTSGVTEMLRGVVLCCSKNIDGFVNHMFEVFDADMSGAPRPHRGPKP